MAVQQQLRHPAVCDLAPDSEMTLAVNNTARGTAVGAWTTRWKYSGRRRPVEAIVHLSDVDVLFVRSRGRSIRNVPAGARPSFS